MEKNMNEVLTSSRGATQGVQNQDQGEYRIFRALRVTDMVIESSV